MGKTTARLEGALGAGKAWALLELGGVLQLLDVPDQVIDPLLQQCLASKRFAELDPVLAQQLEAPLLAALVILSHVDDRLDLGEGEVELLQLGDAIEVDYIGLAVVALSTGRAIVTLQQAKRFIVADGSHRDVTSARQIPDSVGMLLHTIGCTTALGEDSSKAPAIFP